MWFEKFRQKCRGRKKKKNSSSVALEEASESLPSCPEVLEYVEYVFLEVLKTVL